MKNQTVVGLSIALLATPWSLGAAVDVVGRKHLFIEQRSAIDRNPKELIVLKEQRQLFVDDYGIEETVGLNRTMHQPKKKGAVIRMDRQKGDGAVFTENSPIWDPVEKIYKLLICYYDFDRWYKSTDGLHWFKSQDEGTDRHDSLREAHKHRFQLDEFDKIEAEQLAKGSNMSVVYDPTDSSEEYRYKGLLKFLSGYQPVGSPDGVVWRKIDSKLIRTNDTGMLTYDSQEKQYLVTARRANMVPDPEHWAGWGPQAEEDNVPKEGYPGELSGRMVYLFTSTDFINWSSPGKLIFYADAKDKELGRASIEARFKSGTYRKPLLNTPEKYNTDVYDMRVFRYEGVYIGLPAMFHRTGQVAGDWKGFDQYDMEPEQLQFHKKHGAWDGFTNVQLASSRDLTHWERLGERKPFIDCSPLGGGDYDLSCVDWVSEPIVHPDELWFYYTGSKFYGAKFAFEHSESHIVKDNQAICLAVLRRDGFISLDADQTAGSVLTKTFVVPTGELRLNTDAYKGKVEVQLCDEQGTAISGFKSSIDGDRLDAVPKWTEGDLNRYIGKKVRLRFTLTNARLYSYWFK